MPNVRCPVIFMSGDHKLADTTREIFDQCLILEKPSNGVASLNLFGGNCSPTVLHALAALGRRKPAEAVERLQVTLPYELAADFLTGFYLGCLHSAYVRGEALIADHRYAEAASEFQKILDRRGLVELDPIGALAHLQLGSV